jgi:hypothetical protein
MVSGGVFPLFKRLLVGMTKKTFLRSGSIGLRKDSNVK